MVNQLLSSSNLSQVDLKVLRDIRKRLKRSKAFKFYKIREFSAMSGLSKGVKSLLWSNLYNLYTFRILSSDEWFVSYILFDSISDEIYINSILQENVNDYLLYYRLVSRTIRMRYLYKHFSEYMKSIFSIIESGNYLELYRNKFRGMFHNLELVILYKYCDILPHIRENTKSFTTISTILTRNDYEIYFSSIERFKKHPQEVYQHCLEYFFDKNI
ncbi:MAG: hypothetical protein QW806_10255 [Nitrososphaerota archaeon]